ncbi:DUF2719 domain-containing protein [Paenibacillus thiaminolyticus]|uniref:DUF2719 domain-containing protein n=1 Tax=Paenibacillus thiaminolyticus TaxID=49283 RepID=A0A3A3GMN9_PANTH|nr:DUF2719 domain-containing protein [Paenibacillus thiaminolyticus]
MAFQSPQADLGQCDRRYRSGSRYRHRSHVVHCSDCLYFAASRRFELADYRRLHCGSGPDRAAPAGYEDVLKNQAREL